MSEDIKETYWDCPFCGTRNEWENITCPKCGTVNMSVKDGGR